MSKFLFYGCWNNIDCDKEYVYRDLVLNYVKKKEKGLSTFFIAGDNWYSTKLLDKENITTQYYLLSILKTGYDKIYSLNKTIHVAAGNHDEETDGEKPPKRIKDRCMIKTQKKYIDTLNETKDVSLNYSKDLITYDKYIQDSDEMTSSSFIESDLKGFQTTLEELEEIKNIDIHDKTINLYVDDIGIVNYEKYIVIIINTNKLNNDDYINDIERIFQETSDSNTEYKQIFVMGHVPLFPIKKDKIKKKDKDPLFGKGDMLFDLLAAYKYIYMCADSHYFSIMEISKNDKAVIQITSGTGGADPDINTEKYEDTMNIKQNEYNIKYYLLNSYGYSIIRIYKHKIIIIYKKIINAIAGSDTSSNSDGNIFIYSIQRDNGNIKFENTTSIKQVFSDKKFEQYKSDKYLTCNHINKHISTIEDNVVTSKDKKTFCYKKIKDK
jgi:hypothetical protein